MGGTVFPLCSLTWVQTVVEVMYIVETSVKRFLACTATLSSPHSVAGHLWSSLTRILLDPHIQLWVSLLWDHCSFLLSPGAHKVLFVPSKNVNPQSCKFYNQIPLTSKVKVLGSSQALFQIPRLGNLLCVLALSQQCQNLFGIIVLWFVGCLLGSSMMGLMTTSSMRAYATSMWIWHYIQTYIFLLMNTK